MLPHDDSLLVRCIFDVELPRATGVGFGGSVTAAGLFMLPTAAPQLIAGPLTGRIARRIGSRAQLLIGVALMLVAYLALTIAHHHARQLVIATGALGLGLGEIAAECLARGGSLDGDFTLAFAICAGALTLGVGAVLAIPGKGRRIDLHVPRYRRPLPQS